jgi:hypothetical protein
MSALIDVSAIVVDPCFACPLTVERREGAYDDEGLWHEVSLDSFTIQAAVQPTTSEDMDHTAHGERIDGGIKLYTTSDLRSSNAQVPGEADVILYQGERWKVTKVWRWNAHGYYKVMAGRLA